MVFFVAKQTTNICTQKAGKGSKKGHNAGEESIATSKVVVVVGIVNKYFVCKL